jgi:hypothetical protein
MTRNLPKTSVKHIKSNEEFYIYLNPFEKKSIYMWPMFINVHPYVNYEWTRI